MPRKPGSRNQRPKAVAYLRVSSQSRAARGSGLAEQDAAVRAWCVAHGHDLIAVHHDLASGTAGLQDRDGLADALDDLRVSRARVLVVARLDRLARDAILQETLLREAWALDGDVVSCASGEGDLRDDPGDPSRRLIRQVLGAVAEYERALTVLRLRAGRQRRRDSGRYAGDGHPPFGQRVLDGGVVVHEREAAAVDRILQLRADGLSLRRLAAQLHREGITPRRAARWHPQTLARIVARHTTDGPVEVHGEVRGDDGERAGPHHTGATGMHARTRTPGDAGADHA